MIDLLAPLQSEERGTEWDQITEQSLTYVDVPIMETSRLWKSRTNSAQFDSQVQQPATRNALRKMMRIVAASKRKDLRGSPVSQKLKYYTTKTALGTWHLTPGPWHLAISLI